MHLRLTLVFLLACALAVSIPAGATVVYSNPGSLTSLDNSYFHPFGVVFQTRVADSFVSSGAATVTGFDALTMVATIGTPNINLPTTVSWMVLTGGPDWEGGTIVASGVGIWSNTYSFSYNSGNDSIYGSTVSGLNVHIGAGTYWLELWNGATAISPGIWWVQNDGPSLAGFFFPGAPWLSGQINSEAFTIYGGTSAPEPSTILMVGAGFVGIAEAVRRKLLRNVLM